MLEKTNTGSDEVNLIENLPSKSVTVPFEVPLSITVTPIIPELSIASTTVPVTVRC